MKEKTFIKYDRPLLVSMVQADEPQRIKELIDCSLSEGAEAFGMQFCKMKAEHRSKDTYRKLFNYSTLPVYVTNYRYALNQGKNDDTLADELVELAECGATLCDVMGDYFDACEGELTMNTAAIEKQIKLIDELHSKGAEVLMSSHIYRFTPAERVLEIAYEHRNRGADICKIVTGAETMEEQIENLHIINLLKEKLGIPFLFLACGECRILRRIGMSLGNCMSLCVYEYDEFATEYQPLLQDMKLLRDTLKI